MSQDPVFELLTKQSKFLQYLKNFLVNSIDKVKAAERTKPHFLTRLKLLDQYWEKFSTFNVELMSYCDDEVYNGNDYFKNDLYALGESYYVAAAAKIANEINAIESAAAEAQRPPGSGAWSPSAHANANNQPNVSYVQTIGHTTPKLPIPTFDGTQKEWDCFKELFTASVINDGRLSNIVKLQHLLNSVRGPAKQALSSVTVSSNNFEVAWEKLLRRYDNDRRRLYVHLDALINLPLVNKEAADELSRLVDKAEEAIKGLRSLDCPIEHYDNWFVHLLVKKLDKDTKKDWSIHEEDVEGFSTYKNLLSFLENRINSLNDPADLEIDQLQNNDIPLTTSNKKPNQHNNAKSTNALHAQDASKNSGKFAYKCFCCSGNHSAYRCPNFLKLSTNERIKLLKDKGRCIVCFSDKHTSNCPSPTPCGIGGCGQKHHLLLHTDKGTWRVHTGQPIDPTDSSDTEKELETENCIESSNDIDDLGNETDNETTHCAFSKKAILLATARVALRNSSGQRVIVNALIDQGSMRSFVSKRVVSALQLKTTPVQLNIKGIGDTFATKPETFCNVTLASLNNQEFELNLDALVLDTVTSQLPPRRIQTANWPHVQKLRLADPNFAEPKDIDCLLGAEVYAKIMIQGLKHGPPDAPLAQNTKLGWILVGLAVPNEMRDFTENCFTNTFFVNSISNALSKQWEIEKIPPKTYLSEEEMTCEKHFQKTHYREKGRYGVRLPFKIDGPVFPNSRTIALYSWYRLEKRLLKNPTLKVQYDKFMQEYLNLGHMELVPSSEINKHDCYYIPHHAVFHNDKIRVVFNASMPASNGLSLNAALYTGPKLQQDIVLVLLRWRWYQYVFICDIVKMFRQILMHPLDRDWLRIIYDLGNGLQHFRLCTITYGTAPAPYLSLKVLRQILEDFCNRFPAMRAKFIELFLKLAYIDDFFGGAETIDEVIALRKALIEILSWAKIELGKWSANDLKILNHLTNVNQGDRSVEIQEVTSTLGLKWSPLKDTFSFRHESYSKCSKNPVVTKRTVLSEKSKLFDPLGWISPVLIPFTIFCQDLWIDGLDWDTPLSSNFLSTWATLQKQLDCIDRIEIPRWMGSTTNLPWSLHGFADASKRAYSACVYFVPVSGPTTLICSKTKVAPVKTISITRLELLGAQLLAQLIEYILPSFVHKPKDIQCWSDSRNVLCLLKTAPAKLKVFEANRVSDIITILPDVRWKYVPTAHNPADCATRGMSAQELEKYSLWWMGPPWLQSKQNWPNQLDLENFTTTEQTSDTPSSSIGLYTLALSKKPDADLLLNKFHSFNKLIRVFATLLRWTPSRRNYRKTPLSAEELQVSRIQILKLDQELHFSIELDKLKNNLQIPKRSKLAPLRPFMDENGLLRVGSRIENCPFLTFNEKHPIILSKHSNLSRALAWDYHQTYLHAGPQLVLSAISRKYFIMCGKRIIRGVILNCTKCLRYSGRCLSQQMASLPRDRLAYEFPFAVTGVDYAGPIKVTPSKGRGISSSKGYICIFICLVTRAIHVEVASDLSTKTFLAAFDRFVGRRGLPNKMRSDQGTNFIGAEKELRETLFSESSSEFQQIKNYMGNLGISWSFSPPYAPHFGGIWEAAVKSFKFHYKRVLGETSLTYEEHSTLAAQIEACLNSRPLCAISPDGRDPLPLTPGHFLIGRPLKILPPASGDTDTSKTYQDRYKSLLIMKNSFWNKWKKEVLHQMAQSNKWYFPCRNLQTGDLVYIRDELTPPSCWPLAKVVAIVSNRSGLVRAVTVQTAESTFDRPIHKLVYLPLAPQAQQAYLSFLTSITCV